MLMADVDLQDQIEAELIGKIKGEFTWTPEMRLGTAYHAILEQPQLSLSGFYESDGFQFEAEAVDQMLATIPEGGLFEVKTTRELLVPGVGLVTLVSKADHLFGAHLSEFKTTLGSFDAEKYTDSYQWRVMAFLFEPEILTYRVACLSDYKDAAIGLRSIEQVDLFPYPNLEIDVRRMVREFVHYVTKIGLMDWLIPEYRFGQKTVVVS